MHDKERTTNELLERIAGLITYDEALARAGGDPDEERSIREEYLEDIELDLSDLILRARSILRQP